jgi:hypothetical protein
MMGEVVSWVQVPAGETNFRIQGPVPWTRIAGFTMTKQRPDTFIRCDVMVDIETEAPYSVYLGLWVGGVNLASGGMAGATLRADGINGLIVITFSQLLGWIREAGEHKIDLMAAVAHQQAVTFQRKNW